MQRRGVDRLEAAGMPVAIASAAVLAGGRVELVGKVPDGADGDAILLSAARSGVGHVAVIRSVGAVTIDDGPDARERSESLDTLAGLDDAEPANDRVLEPDGSGAGPALDAGDVELALRYLPDYDVVVIAQQLDPAATTAVIDAARWANAWLIAIASSAAPGLPADTTVLEPPGEDAAGAFATVVGRYAAALDRGDDPGEAFGAAYRDLGWTPVASE